MRRFGTAKTTWPMIQRRRRKSTLKVSFPVSRRILRMSLTEEGKYFKFTGRHQTHPSPQRTPFLFQAGTSKSGQAFAAKHAEGIYTGGIAPAGSKDGIAFIRAQAAARGRDPSTIKAFIGMTPILGHTIEEAQAKYEEVVKYADPIAGLAQFCGYAGIDLSSYPLDEPFDLSKETGQNQIHTIIRAFEEGDTTGLPWTPRRVGMKQAMGGVSVPRYLKN